MEKWVTIKNFNLLLAFWLFLVVICFSTTALEIPVSMNITNQSIRINVNNTIWDFNNTPSYHNITYPFDCPTPSNLTCENATIMACEFTLEDYGEVIHKHFSSHEEWLQQNLMEDCVRNFNEIKDNYHKCQLNLTTIDANITHYKTRINYLEDKTDDYGTERLLLMVGIVVLLIFCVFMIIIYVKQPRSFVQA